MLKLTWLFAGKPREHAVGILANGILVVACTIISLLVVSFLLFSLFEIYPSLPKFLNLHAVRYYALTERYVTDPELVFRTKPFYEFESSEFKGDLFNSIYGVEVPSLTYTASFDENGFRDDGSTGISDIVVIGDSYIAFGLDKPDTLSERLGRSSSLTSANLGMGWYGPFQYVELLKRYGLRQNPRYALFCFFEGNDIADIRKYIEWQDGKSYYAFNLSSKSFLERYLLALADIGLYLAKYMRRLIPDQRDKTVDERVENLVELDLHGHRIRTAFAYYNQTKSSDELLETHEWLELKRLLSEFKEISTQKDIVPVVVFIPTKAHIYAEYSSDKSGKNWLKIREEQIAANKNVVTAMTSLAKTVGIRFVNLAPVFEAYAKEGKFLWYPFDTHWNSEAREIAAKFIVHELNLQNR